MSDELDTTAQETPAPGTGEVAGDKPAESTKTFPQSYEEMSDEQKQLYILGAKHHQAWVQQEEAKKAKQPLPPKTSHSDDDPNAPVEKEIKKLINQARIEAGEGADGEKILTKALTKLLVAQQGITQKMAREMATEMVAPIQAAVVGNSAEKFFQEYDYLAPKKEKVRDIIEKYGVPVDDLLDVVESVRPKKRADEDIDETPAPRTPRDIDDFSFLETPTRRGEAPTNDFAAKAAAAAKAAVKAEQDGKKAERDKQLLLYQKYRRRTAA